MEQKNPGELSDAGAPDKQAPRIQSRQVQRSLYQIRIMVRQNASRDRALEGPAISAGSHRLGFTLQRVRS